MSNPGWKCPECGRCYAPWVMECKYCPVGTGEGSNTIHIGQGCLGCGKNICTGESSGCPAPKHKPTIS